MTPPARVAQVVDGDTFSVLLSLDPSAVLVTLTAREVTITLSPREATALGFHLVDAAEATPVRCVCGRLAMTAERLCVGCATALDRRREATS